MSNESKLTSVLHAKSDHSATLFKEYKLLWSCHNKGYVLMLELEEFVASANKLYTIPDICLSLNELVNKPNCSIEDIAQVVRYDPALSVRVLKIANSALYSGKGSISDIEQAIMKIGTDELCNIAIATSAALMFKGAGETRINLTDYWEHSVYTAVLAKQINKKCKLNPTGLMFITGLLHNIGFLVVLERLPYFPVDLNDVIGIDKKGERFENAKLGFSFRDVSSQLLRCWNLSEEISRAISLATPGADEYIVKENCVCLQSAIKIADSLISNNATIYLEHTLHESEIAVLGMTQETLDELVEFSRDNVRSIVEIIQG